MSFLETPRFPDAVAFGFIGGPKFNTSIVTVLSGNEKRNANWTSARGMWSASQEAKSEALTAALISFFRCVNGPAIGFRFKDWSDFQVVAASTGKVRLVSTGIYQLIKRYTIGALTYDRDITKPVPGLFTIAGGGVYSLATATGLLTHSSGAAPTGWTGDFDCPCRFGSDEMKIEGVDMSDGPIFSWNDIDIVEIRDIA